MTAQQGDNHHDSEPIATLIGQIKESKVNPKVLSAEDRRRCVDALWAEGLTVPNIAQILRCAERTVYRDRTELRAAQALQVHPQFSAQMAGELIRQAEISMGRLRRIARETTASAMERCMAENFAFKVYVEMVGKLQSMGYLPRIPNSVTHVVTTGGDAVISTYDQIKQRIEQLDALDREQGIHDPQRQAKRKALLETVMRGRTAAEIEELAKAPPDGN